MFRSCHASLSTSLTAKVSPRFNQAEADVLSTTYTFIYSFHLGILDRNIGVLLEYFSNM